MVQAAPNESRVTGMVTGRQPDPERPGFVILQMRVDEGRPVAGERSLAPAAGADFVVTVRETLVAGIGPEAALQVSCSMVGPGVWMASAVEAAPSEELQLTPPEDVGEDVGEGGAAAGAEAEVEAEAGGDVRDAAVEEAGEARDGDAATVDADREAGPNLSP